MPRFRAVAVAVVAVSVVAAGIGAAVGAGVTLTATVGLALVGEQTSGDRPQTAPRDAGAVTITAVGLGNVAVPAGWPTAATTGVPAGTALRPSGSLTITRAGTVVDRLLVDGCIDVKAPNVTIRRSKIRCSRTTTAVRNFSDGHLLIEDVEIDGRGAVRAAVGFGRYTLRRVNIHNVVDGPRVGSDTTVVDSYIHDLVRVPDSHNDTLQITGANRVLIRHNTLLPYRADTRDPMNAALMIGTEIKRELRDVLVEDNYVNGGNYTFNVRRDVQGVSNVVFRGNRFGRDFRYGPARVKGPGRSFDHTNVWHDTGQPVSR